MLLFGTGNRYGRAIDRVHELAELVEKRNDLVEAELRLRIRQLEAGETRTSLIVRALTCFYTAVACFVASTLISLIGAVLASARINALPSIAFAVAFIAGAIGVVAMISGAALLTQETRFSFCILREEKNYLTGRVHERLAMLSPSSRK